MFSLGFHRHRTLFRPVTGFVFAMATVMAQDTPEEKRFDEIPDRFAQRQDEYGFFWQVDQFGALSSGDAQYLASGLRLATAGADFTPGSATLRDDSVKGGVVDLTLTENRDGLTISRTIWFDASRGGVRLVDTFTNKSGKSIALPVELRTTYPFAWQNLYGNNGSLLEKDPNPTLGTRDTGLTVKFSQADGRQDTLILTSGEKSGIRPEITGSANQRELILRYSLTVASGESASLVHWILQRNLGSPEDAEAEWNPFFQRRRLVHSRVGGDLAANVRNFDSSAFPQGGQIPAKLQSLTSLNRLTDRIGLHRREEDVLWVSATNQLSGKVNSDATVTVQNPFAGAEPFPISEVAAITGGGGIGRLPKLYLRDGRVFAGKISAENLDLKIGGDSSFDALVPAEFNLLLCALSAEDGEPPEGTAGFVQLRSGSVLAVAEPADLKITTVHPWGRDELRLEEIVELSYVSQPTPKFRLVRPDRSRLSVFLPVETLSVSLAGGEPVDLGTSTIANYWQAALTGPTTGPIEDFWLEADEVPGETRPDNGFLLRGNNLIAGSLTADSLTLMDQQSTVEIATAEVDSIQRHFETSGNALPVFEIELKNGDVLKGNLQGSNIAITQGGKSTEVPLPHLLSFWSK